MKDPLEDSAFAFFVARMKRGAELDAHERDFVAAEFHRSRRRERRLEAAAQAARLFQGVRTWGRLELDQWQALAVTAGAVAIPEDAAPVMVPVTPEGLDIILRAALAPAPGDVEA